MCFWLRFIFGGKMRKKLQNELIEIKNKIINDYKFRFTYKQLAQDLNYAEITIKRKMKILCELYKVSNKEELIFEFKCELMA